MLAELFDNVTASGFAAKKPDQTSDHDEHDGSEDNVSSDESDDAGEAQQVSKKARIDPETPAQNKSKTTAYASSTTSSVRARRNNASAVGDSIQSLADAMKGLKETDLAKAIDILSEMSDYQDDYLSIMDFLEKGSNATKFVRMPERFRKQFLDRYLKEVGEEENSR